MVYAICVCCLKKELTRKAARVIARQYFPVHILTKSTLILWEIDLFQEIRRVYAALSFTIASGEDDLSHKLNLEPRLPQSVWLPFSNFLQRGDITGFTICHVQF
jgi:hypothetical protein